MYSHVHKYVYMDGCLDLISFFYFGFFVNILIYSHFLFVKYVDIIFMYT